MTETMLAQSERARILDRIGYGIRSAERARAILISQEFIPVGQFLLDLDNANEAMMDSKQRFDNAVADKTAAPDPSKEKNDD